MRKFHTFLSIILILLITTIVRIYPIIGYSPEPVSYGGGAIYHLNYVLDNGHFLSQTDASDLVNGNMFSAGINEYAAYPMFQCFYIAIMQICGVEPSSFTYQILNVIVLTLPTMMIFLCFFYFFKKDQQPSPVAFSIILLCAILLYTQMASVHPISQQGARGILFMLFPIYLLFINNQNDLRRKTLALIFIILLPLVYFTAASFFLLWLSMILIVALYINKKHKIVENEGFAQVLNIVLIFSTAYIGVSMYMSLSRSGTILGVLDSLINLIVNGFSSFNPASIVIPQDYLTGTSFENKVKNAVAAAFTTIPVIWYILEGKKCLGKYNLPHVVLISGILALPILVFLLFLWLGGLSIGRLPEYGTLMAALVTISVVPRLEPKKKRLFTIIIIITVLLSGLVYVTDENTVYRRVTYDEAESSYWLTSQIDNESIFTDHRLSAMFISRGHLNTYGIVESKSANHTIYDLNSVYYENSSQMALERLENDDISYVFMSTNMIKWAPSIMVYNYQVKPAPDLFLEKYDLGQSFAKIYSSGEIRIYHLEVSKS